MEGIKIYGQPTLDMTKLNVNEKYRNAIALFKKWSRNNFYFELNLVRYLDEDSKTIGEFPFEVEDEVILEKDKFDTPFSHLLYFAFILGRQMETEESREFLDELAQSVGNTSSKNLL